MLTKKEQRIITSLNKTMSKMDERQIGRVEGAQMMLYLISNAKSKREKNDAISQLEMQCRNKLIKA